MSNQKHREDTIELVSALLRIVPDKYTSDYGRWVWVAGRLASMIIRWSRMDIGIRQEIRAIVEHSKHGDKR